MDYKTILVCLSDKGSAARVLEPALDLGRRHDARVVAMHVYCAVSAPAIAVPGSGQMPGMALGALRQESDGIRNIFTRMMADQPFVGEWRAVETTGFDRGDVVLDQARCADLVVAGQARPELAAIADLPERLAIESGRPVLVVPHSGRHPQVGRNAMIAWKPTREFARAVFDALPLLKAAENVQLLEVVERPQDGAATDTPVAAALSRHGIKLAQRKTFAPELSVGEEILARLSDLGGDLLVMGAYGHSRAREFIWGGVTRHVARHMTVPTLWSH